MKTTMPDINIYLETGRSETIIKNIKNIKKNLFDIAIVVGEGARSKNIESKSIYTDSFGLYKAPGMEAAFNSNLIYFSFPMNNTKESMSRFGFHQSIVCDNLETVRSLTEQAVGVGLMPHRVARQSVMNHKLTPFVHPKIKNNSFDKHHISISYPKKQSTPYQLFVLEEIERFLQIWQQN